MKTFASTPRRVSIVSAAAAVGLLGALPGVSTIAHAAPQSPGEHRSNCPKAESIVPHLKTHTRTLAPGVVLTKGKATDAKGRLDISTVRINLAQKGVSLTPLVKSVAERSPLSTLARHHRQLVAATNTGYFDFYSGAPTVPFIQKGVATVLSTTHQPAVGLNAKGVAQEANVWLDGVLTVGKHTHSIAAVNETYPPSGIAIYTPQWGSQTVHAHYSSTVRTLVNGVLGTAQFNGRGYTVPSNGDLLVANSSSGRWLADASHKSKATVSYAVKTNAAKPFVQGYGTGVTLVAKRGVARTNYTCDSSNTSQPARTAIGLSKNGTSIIMVIVAEHPGTNLHGLDEQQMSSLMVQLGVSRAYSLDGSGSSELLATAAGSSTLQLQNYPADGQEREMPLGLGIAYKAPAKKHKHTHKH